MDLNLLKVFAAIHREQNLSRAAERLYLTQSAVSHSLRKLREHYGDPLFIRDGRSMRPTPLAQRIAPQLNQTLLELEQLARPASSFDASQAQRHFIIGARDALESLLLVKLVHRFAADAPLVQLSSVKLDRRNMTRDLVRGRLDFALDIPTPVGPDIAHTPLVKDALCVVAKNNHPYAQQPTGKRYLQARHIAVSARPSGPTIVDFALQQHNKERAIGLRCQHYHAACAVAAESDLLVTLPRGIAEQMHNPKDTKILPAPFALPPIELHLYWCKALEQNPDYEWFREQALLMIAPS